MSQIAILVAFISCLSLAALVAWSYGYVVRVLQGKGYAQFFLGVMLGGIALLQILSATEVSVGVLIAMQYVPVVLAAAYLGSRGAISCLFIAIASRVYMGGEQMEADLVGLVLAGLIGVCWREMTSWRDLNKPTTLVTLACLTPLRLLALLMLPADAAFSLLVNVLPFQIVLEMISIILVGLLFEREFRSDPSLERGRSWGTYHPRTGLLTPEGLQEAYDRTAQTHSDAQGAGILLIQIRYQDWLSRRFGMPVVDDVRATLRGRLETDLRRSDLVGVTRRNEIAVVLYDRSTREMLNLQRVLRRSLGAERITLSDGAEIRISVDITFACGTGRQPLCQLIQDARVCDGHQNAPVLLPGGAVGKTVDALFAQANRSI